MVQHGDTPKCRIKFMKQCMHKSQNVYTIEMCLLFANDKIPETNEKKRTK